MKNIDDLHRETKVLPVNTHTDMLAKKISSRMSPESTFRLSDNPTSSRATHQTHHPRHPRS